MVKTTNVNLITAHVPHGHKKGGQSQNRFQRLQEESRHEYLKQVAKSVREFFEENPVEEIMIGGPGMTKQEFIDHYLDPALREKVIYVVDTGNGGEDGMRDLLQKAKEDHVLENTTYMKERKIVGKFMELVARDGPVEYGEREVRAAIDDGRVEDLLLSESLLPGTIDDLASRASMMGTPVTVLSVDTEEGAMFFSGFTGIGAFLRWKRE